MAGDYDHAMDIYKRIGQIGPEAKAEADAFMQGIQNKYTEDHPAPPDEIAQGLEGILSKHSQEHPSHKPNASHSRDAGKVTVGKVSYDFGMVAKAAALIAALYLFL